MKTIFVVTRSDWDSTAIVRAYVSKEKAIEVADSLNREEDEKHKLYNEWVMRCNNKLDGEDEDDEMPDYQDYIYGYQEVSLVE